MTALAALTATIHLRGGGAVEYVATHPDPGPLADVVTRWLTASADQVTVTDGLGDRVVIDYTQVVGITLNREEPE